MKLDAKKIISLKEKDIKNLGLKNVRTAIKRTSEIKLEEELNSYNSEITKNGNDEITIVQGRDGQGNKVKLFYYNNKYGGIDRQQRNYNNYGDIVQVKRNSIFEDGIVSNEDEVKIAYKYSKAGIKVSALSQDEILGVTYYKYDKDGNVKTTMSKECITQKFYYNGTKYEVCDGYFKPTKNGYMYRLFSSAWDLEPQSMQRTIKGNISEARKNKILQEFDENRQEKVLQTLKNIEFATSSIADKSIDENQIGIFVQNFKNAKTGEKEVVSEQLVQAETPKEIAIVEYKDNMFCKMKKGFRSFFHFK